MNNQEIIELIKQIEKDYPKFEIKTEEEYQVWKDTLNKISYDLAKAKYEAHRNNPEFNKYPPKMTWFVYEPKQELKELKYTRYCKYCGRIMYNEALDLHEDRHRSVNYIKKNKKKYWDKEMTQEDETKLLNLPDKEFDSWYYEFLKKVLNHTKSPLERRNIKNIIYLTENPNKTLLLEQFMEGVN